MQKPEITVVGAGLVGSLLACFLGRRGFKVDLYERRPDMRQEAISAGRSINLVASVRGLHALKQVGLDQEVLKHSVPLRGRMMHSVDGKLTFQRYGKDDSECIHSISRGVLNKILLSAAEKSGDVTIHFNQRAVKSDFETKKVTFRDVLTSQENTISIDRVIGTDGSASVIRDAILDTLESEPHIDELDYGYKELTIPAGPGGKFQLEKNALHIWPRGTYMLIALPNEDGSFTCTLFLSHRGDLSFESLEDPTTLRELFEEQFSDVLPLIPDLEKEFFANPTGHMVTVKCQNWHDRERALVLGDAAHAIVPFFGQGMNCGFEDCSVMDELLSEQGRMTETVFADLQRLRKTNADAIADLAVENFVEMRDKVADKNFLKEKAVERLLQEKFPGEYVSRYSLVTFSREPYRFAYEMGLVQAQILSELCKGISAPEQVDLVHAAELIRTRLTPLFNALKKGQKHGS